MNQFERLMHILKAQVGNKESPANSNCVSYNMWYYGKDVRAPWCMAFVMYCFDMAGINLGVKTASCGELMRFSKTVNSWCTDQNLYTIGDIVLFDFTGKRKTPTHCGVIIGFQNGKVLTIEGNTGVGDDANGGKVMERERSYNHIVGVMHPVFEEEMTMTDKEIYDAVTRYSAQAAVPKWARKEYQEAIGKGITDGSNPCGLTPRYQTAIMVKRAMEASHEQ